MKIIVYRFEGDFAVVEIDKGCFINMPKQLIPGAIEGDVISIIIDRNDTSNRKKKITSLMDQLFEN